MKYFVKTPWWVKKIYPSYYWDIKTREKILFLSFDDGPHPKATPFVLDQLRRYNARASFFCVGKNVDAYPSIFNRILEEGHSVGNHTYQHVNGWKTADSEYLQDISKAAVKIDSILFRPPYGRIRSFQAKNVAAAMKKTDAKIIMWDVLSGDFDENITGERCLQNVVLNARSGSIIVFHDSEKAFRLLQYSLPLVLEYFSKKGYRFETLKCLEEK
jgi:peptidoglycan/xylan/chitin deacetylase (PgdA/CDA1 family)